MAITKSEKDYWVRELKKELKELREEHTEEYERCMELARERAVQELGIGRLLGTAGKLHAEAFDKYEVYRKHSEKTSKAVNAVNEKLKGIRVETGHEYPQYDRPRLSYNAPQNAYNYNYTKSKDIDLSFLDTLAKLYIDDVLEEQGATDIIHLQEAYKMVERRIMLATTSKQLREFLTWFSKDVGIEI